MQYNSHNSPHFSIGEPIGDLSADAIKDILQTDSYTLQPITGGLSGAKLYKVCVDGHDYLIRHTSGIFGSKEIHQEFYIQEFMSNKQITPKVYYSDSNLGIIVMDFIENTLPKGRSPNILNNIPNGLDKIIKLMRTLHKTPREDKNLSYRIAQDYIAYSLANTPQDFLQTAYVEIIKSYVKKEWPLDQLVITHNDFRSDNLLFNQQFQLIDWELSGLSHPLYDLAYFSNYQAISQDESSDILSLYLERMPRENELGTFKTLRGFAYVFSAILCLPGLAADGFKPLNDYYHHLTNDTIRQIWDKVDNGDLDINNDMDEFSISMRLLAEAKEYL